MDKELIDALNQRYATKIFDPEKKISEKDLSTLIEALRLTPTSYGLQLMKTIVVDNSEKRAALLSHSYNQKQVVDSSHLIILCREKEVNEKHISNYINNIATTREVKHEHLEGFESMMKSSILSMPTIKQNNWMDNQVYIALGNLLNACALLKIDSCPMEGFVSEKYDEILGLDVLNLSSVLAIPVGYRSDLDKNATTKKVRRSKEDFLIRM